MEGLVNPHPLNTYNNIYDMNLDEPVINVMGIFLLNLKKIIVEQNKK